MKKLTKEELRKILLDHQEWLMSSGALGVRANLTGANLRWADLTGANLTKADLTKADLTGANLRWANLTKANLRWADLRWADLTGANLTGANLTKADLTEANLTFNCDLASAKTDKRYLQIGCIGSEKRRTLYCFEDNLIYCGYFTGSLEEFEDKVEETHKDNEQYLKEYRGFIAYIRSLK